MQTITLPDGCLQEVANIERDKCFVKIPLTESFLASRKLNAKYKVSDLNDPEFIKTEIAEGRLFILPIIKEVIDNNSEGVQTATTGYGRHVVTSSQVNMNYNYNILEISSCTFAKLQSLDRVPLTTWAISNNQIAGTLVEESGEVYLKGQHSSITLPSSFMMREAEAELANIPMTYIANNAKINYFLEVNYDLLSINGLIDTFLTPSNPTTTTVTVEVKGGCQKELVSGFGVDDFVVLDDQGQVVTLGSVTETSTGVYLLTFDSAVSAGDYSVNLDGVIELSGEQYAPLATAPTFEVV